MSEFNPSMIKAKARAAAQAGLFRAGDKISAKSQAEVPRDTGRLAAGSYLKTAQTQNGVSLEVGYSADYAAVVHQKVDYLARAFEETKRSVAELVKKSVEEAIR